ncbi:MAG TPA: hypothetical protein DCZ95_11905 [Verrucomicrobia bacterium]|nr:MAG: hypothetical protein A2X46_13950 [Lentisphaerae bacterium GWF2_57_35]HBA84789.1 hypothetical protein [Verrucomicrobiota bacterium]
MNTEPIIAIEQLSHTFGRAEAARTVLKNISVNFYAGEIVIVMGPSGAGKTTLLTLAGALRSPQNGSVRVVGRELYGASAQQQLEVRQHIGFIFQHHNLLDSLTALENVQMGLAHQPFLPFAESRRRASAMLERVGLADHAKKPPAELSGGQRQRVAIARALVRDPAIILADEPTAALDSHSGREIVELLQKLAREQHYAILLVTHDNRILDIADRILTLEDGCIEENNRTLERIRKGLAETMRAIARYPTLLMSAQPAAAGHLQATTDRLAAWRREAATLASRKLSPTLLGQTTALAEAAEHLHQIEIAVRRFCEQIGPTGEVGAAGPADRLFQSLDFLLLTASDAFASETAEEMDCLILLTGDRGEMMQALRARQTETLSADLAPSRNLFFDLTDIFTRTVYFLHELTSAWKMSK